MGDRGLNLCAWLLDFMSMHSQLPLHISFMYDGLFPSTRKLVQIPVIYTFQIASTSNYIVLFSLEIKLSWL